MFKRLNILSLYQSLISFFLLLLLSSSICSALQLNNISHLYFFGDSLTDDGYMDQSIDFLPPGKRPIYTSPKGHVWAYYLAKDLNQPISPNNLNPLKKNNDWVSGRLNGNDYAAGGARAGADVKGVTVSKHYNPPSFQHQITNFLSQHHQKADPKALYLIWMGANDILGPIFYKKPFSIIRSINHSTQIIAKEIKRLKLAGAKNIIILNLPPIGDTPLMNSSILTRLGANLVSSYFDRKLRIALKQAKVHVITFNAKALLISMLDTIKNKGVYHYDNIELNNATDSACSPHHYTNNIPFIFALTCIPPKQVNTSQYVFADWIHPTPNTHHILALELEVFLKQVN